MEKLDIQLVFGWPGVGKTTFGNRAQEDGLCLHVDGEDQFCNGYVLFHNYLKAVSEINIDNCELYINSIIQFRNIHHQRIVYTCGWPAASVLSIVKRLHTPSPVWIKTTRELSEKSFNLREEGKDEKKKSTDYVQFAQLEYVEKIMLLDSDIRVMDMTPLMQAKKADWEAGYKMFKKVLGLRKQKS